MADDRLHKRSRQLTVTSGVVIVFILSGAEFATRGSVFGVFLTFQETSVLYWAAILVFAYFALTFSIVEPRPHSRVWTNIVVFARTDCAWRRRVREVGRDALARDDVPWKLNDLPQLGGMTGPQLIPHDLVCRADTKPFSVAWPWATITAPVEVMNDGNNRIGTGHVPIPRLMVLRFIGRWVARFPQNDDSIWHSALPAALALYAEILILWTFIEGRL